MLRPRLMVVVDLAGAADHASEKESCKGGALKGFPPENAPERQRCQCVFESNAAMTAPMFTEKSFGVTP